MTFRRFQRRKPFRGYGRRGYVPAPIALGTWWWEANADYLDIDVGVRDWTDRVNGLVVTQATGTAQPAFDGAKVTFDSASSQVLSSVATIASLIGNKPFMASFLTEASVFYAGGSAGAPRCYLEGASYSYNDFGVVSFVNSTAKQVLTFGHDGTNAFVRRDGTQLGSAVKALSGLLSIPFQLGSTRGVYMEGDLYDAVLADASTWGASFAANRDAIEDFLLGRV